MKEKIFTASVFLGISLLFCFNSLASQNTLIDADNEKTEFEYLKDEAIRKINESGPRSELDRDATNTDLDFDKAYRVYANSNLFTERTDSAEEIKGLLENGSYIWQVPVFIGNDTVLVDFYKNTEINADIPEDAKQILQETLGQWQVGAMYVYDNCSVDFQNVLKESLESVDLSADDYSCEFVSGLPGIRYPVAVVFDQYKAKYIIPAESATARAFEQGSEAMEYTASSSNANREYINDQDGFPVYNFNDVANASRNASRIGLGGTVGISPQNNVKHDIFVAFIIVVGLGGGFIAIKKHQKR